MGDGDFPAWDEVAQGEGGGLVAFVGGVEFGAVFEGTAVVDSDSGGCSGFDAIGGFGDLEGDTLVEGLDAGDDDKVGGSVEAKSGGEQDESVSHGDSFVKMEFNVVASEKYRRRCLGVRVGANRGSIQQMAEEGDR